MQLIADRGDLRGIHVELTHHLLNCRHVFTHFVCNLPLLHR
ncbi:Uncharacterised protein [Vibrio cholerae]|nr:Uncharacterised protein [Vibrio cholerae]